MGACFVGGDPGLTDKASIKKFQNVIVNLAKTEQGSRVRCPCCFRWGGWDYGPERRVRRFSSSTRECGSPADGNTLTTVTMAVLDYPEFQPDYGPAITPQAQARIAAAAAAKAETDKAAAQVSAASTPAEVKTAAASTQAAAVKVVDAAPPADQGRGQGR